METLAYLAAAGIVLGAIIWLSYDAWQFQAVAVPEAVLTTTSGVALERRLARTRLVRATSAPAPWRLFAAVSAATVLCGALAGWLLPL